MPRIAYVDKNFAGSSLKVIETANAICAEYRALGYDLTLRQLYYQFVSRGLIANKDTEYKRLGSIVNDARLAGLLDWSYIIDRTRNVQVPPAWDSPDDIIGGAAGGYQEDLWASQPTRVEVWIEKDALVGVIAGVCRALAVPYFSCRGYTSQSEVWGAAQRLLRHQRRGQDVRILHLGDHDPSGIDMTRDIRERLDLFMYGRGPVVQRLALNWAQVQRYDPPPNPAKLTDSRVEGYLRRYGLESWELDALEPTVIGRLIRRAVHDVRDESLWRTAVSAQEQHRLALTAAATHWDDVVEWLRDEGYLNDDEAPDTLPDEDDVADDEDMSTEGVDQGDDDYTAEDDD